MCAGHHHTATIETHQSTPSLQVDGPVRASAGFLLGSTATAVGGHTVLSGDVRAGCAVGLAVGYFTTISAMTAAPIAEVKRHGWQIPLSASRS
jgi:hypothetical protein